MEVTKSMYQLAKKIVNEYENKKENKVVVQKKNIILRKLDFKELIRPYTSQYDSSLLNDFYFYWTEHGENDRKFRKEKEKSFNIERRLKNWAKRSKEFNSQKEKPITLAQKMKNQYGIE